MVTLNVEKEITARYTPFNDVAKPIDLTIDGEYTELTIKEAKALKKELASAIKNAEAANVTNS